MSFDIENIGKATWFRYFESAIKDDGTVEYFEPKPGAEEVCIKSPSAEFIRKLYKKTHTVEQVAVLNPKTRGMEFVNKELPQTPEQEAAWQDGYIDEAIQDWRITAPGGDAIPCALANKRKMMQYKPFDRFVKRCIELCDEKIVAYKEAETENF